MLERSLAKFRTFAPRVLIVVGGMCLSLVGGCVGQDSTAGVVNEARPALDAARPPDADLFDAPGVEPLDAGIRFDAAPPKRCDPTKPFGSLEAVIELTAPSYDGDISLSADELDAVITSNRLGNPTKIFEATRGAPSSLFSTPQLVDVSPGYENSPSLAGDGLTVVFDDADPFAATASPSRLLWATRSSRASAFGSAQPLLNVSVAGSASRHPVLSGDELALYYSFRDIAGGSTETFLYVATRATKSAPFTNPTAVPGLHMAGSSDDHPAITADQLVIYFRSNRPGSAGEDIWVASRATVSSSFGAPTRVSEVSTAGNDRPGFVSADDCVLYLTTNGGDAGGGYDVFRATKPR